MTENEEAFELKKRAIEIIEKRGIFDSLNWIVEKGKLELSDHLKVSTKKSEKDFKDCQKYFSFEFNNHKYELFFENGHTFYTPDDSPYWGDIRLLYDNELVLKSKYEKEYSEYGSKYRLIKIDSVVDVLRLGEWVNDLPTLINYEKDALKKIKESRDTEKNAKEAEKIKKNFDLGKFSK
jgi:hypothetical protein